MQQAAMGIAVMAVSERHLVAAVIILRFLQDDRRFGCGHDAAWDGGYLLPRMRSENQRSRGGDTATRKLIFRCRWGSASIREEYARRE